MRFLSMLVWLVLPVSLTFAQSDRGTVTGTVTDPAGAVIASASIVARNIETGAVYQAATSATGNYTIAELPVGAYEVSVTVPGFRSTQEPGYKWGWRKRCAPI